MPCGVVDGSCVQPQPLWRVAWDEMIGAGVVDVISWWFGFVAVTSVDGMQDFVICCAISSSVQPQSKIASANPSQGMK